jgi:hypothetical protein
MQPCGFEDGFPALYRKFALLFYFRPYSRGEGRLLPVGYDIPHVSEQPLTTAPPPPPHPAVGPLTSGTDAEVDRGYACVKDRIALSYLFRALL